MSLFDNSDAVQEKLLSLIRVGEVTSVDYANLRARVTFDDDDGLVSYDLPILQRNTLENHDFCGVDLGEDVLCLFLASGTEEGFILGSFYAGEVTPPESSGDKRTVVFADGTRASYDRAAHELTITIDGTKITANRQDVSVETPNNVNVKGGSQVNVEGGQQVNVNGGAAINLNAPVVTLTMGGTTMRLNGSSCTIDTKQVHVTGDVIVDGDVVAGSVSLRGHTHTCPDGGTSAPN